MIGCLFSLSLMAQSDCSGVYLTPKDFLDGKLCRPYFARKQSKPSDNDLLYSKRLVINRDGVIEKLARNNIYAIMCSDGKIIRLFHAGHYTLLDPGEALLLYKVTIYPAAKGDVLRTLYYFSKDASSDIEALTLENLRLAFKANRKFELALDAQFPGNSDLCAYDGILHCYKLSRVYAASN